MSKKIGRALFILTIPICIASCADSTRGRSCFPFDDSKTKSEVATSANVRDFGAVGDGIHDDTEAIQSALDSRSEGQGSVYFPTGTYLVTKTIRLPVGRRISLFGDGSQTDGQAIRLKGASRILYRGDGPALDGAGVEGKAFVSLLMSEIEVVGDGATGDGLRLNSARTCLFENVRFAGFASGAGIHISGGDSQNLVFNTVVSEENAYGMLAAREHGQRYGWTQIVVQNGSQFQYNRIGNIWASEGSSLSIRDTYLNAGAEETVWVKLLGVYSYTLANNHAELGFPRSSGDSIVIDRFGSEESLSGLITGNNIVRSNQTSGTGIPIRVNNARSLTIASNQFNTPRDYSPISIGASAKDVEIGNQTWTWADLKIAEIDPAAEGIRVTFLDVVPFLFTLPAGSSTALAATTTIPFHSVPSNSWLLRIQVALGESLQSNTMRFSALLDGKKSDLSLEISPEDGMSASSEQPPLQDDSRLSTDGILSVGVDAPEGTCTPDANILLWMGVNTNKTNPM